MLWLQQYVANFFQIFYRRFSNKQTFILGNPSKPKSSHNPIPSLPSHNANFSFLGFKRSISLAR